MDWTLAIERHRQALRRAVDLIAARAGLRQWAVGSRPSGAGRAPDGDAGQDPDGRLPSAACRSPADCLTLPRHLHRMVLKLVFAAEAAARRLVVATARGLIVPGRPRAPEPVPEILPKGSAGTGIVATGIAFGALGLACAVPLPARSRTPFRPLPLLDPLRGLPRGRVWAGFGHGVPRAVVMDADAKALRLSSPTDPIDATRLALRLAAIADALGDLPRHALRLARWKGRRDAARAAGRPHRQRPLRPGPPPAWRRRSIHPVHAVLDDVHGLAHWALELPDTS